MCAQRDGAADRKALELIADLNNYCQQVLHIIHSKEDELQCALHAVAVSSVPPTRILPMSVNRLQITDLYPRKHTTTNPQLQQLADRVSQRKCHTSTLADMSLGIAADTVTVPLSHQSVRLHPAAHSESAATDAHLSKGCLSLVEEYCDAQDCSPNASSISPVRCSMDLSVLSAGSAHPCRAPHGVTLPRRVRFSSRSPQVALFSVDRQTSGNHSESEGVIPPTGLPIALEVESPRTTILQDVSTSVADMLIHLGQVRDNIQSSSQNSLGSRSGRETAMPTERGGHLSTPEPVAHEISVADTLSMDPVGIREQSASCSLESPCPALLLRRKSSRLQTHCPTITTHNTSAVALRTSDFPSPQRILPSVSLDDRPFLLKATVAQSHKNSLKKGLTVAEGCTGSFPNVPFFVSPSVKKPGHKRVRIQIPSKHAPDTKMESQRMDDIHQVQGSGAGIVLACGPTLYFP